MAATPMASSPSSSPGPSANATPSAPTSETNATSSSSPSSSSPPSAVVKPTCPVCKKSFTMERPETFALHVADCTALPRDRFQSRVLNVTRTSCRICNYVYTASATEAEMEFHEFECKRVNKYRANDASSSTSGSKRNRDELLETSVPSNGANTGATTIDTSGDDPTGNQARPIVSVFPTLCCGCGNSGRQLVRCQGICGRAFHQNCIGESFVTSLEARESWTCSECQRSLHRCVICGFLGKDGNDLIRCKLSDCGFFFHRQCLKQNNFPNNSPLLCPRHTCEKCCRQETNLRKCLSCVQCFHMEHVFDCDKRLAAQIAQAKNTFPGEFGIDKNNFKVCPAHFPQMSELWTKTRVQFKRMLEKDDVVLLLEYQNALLPPSLLNTSRANHWGVVTDFELLHEDKVQLLTVLMFADDSKLVIPNHYVLPIANLSTFNQPENAFKQLVQWHLQSEWSLSTLRACTPQEVERLQGQGHFSQATWNCFKAKLTQLQMPKSRFEAFVTEAWDQWRGFEFSKQLPRYDGTKLAVFSLLDTRNRSGNANGEAASIDSGDGSGSDSTSGGNDTTNGKGQQAGSKRPDKDGQNGASRTGGSSFGSSKEVDGDGDVNMDAVEGEDHTFQKGTYDMTLHPILTQCADVEGTIAESSDQEKPVGEDVELSKEHVNEGVKSFKNIQFPCLESPKSVDWCEKAIFKTHPPIHKLDEISVKHEQILRVAMMQQDDEEPFPKRIKLEEPEKPNSGVQRFFATRSTGPFAAMACVDADTSSNTRENPKADAVAAAPAEADMGLPEQPGDDQNRDDQAEQQEEDHTKGQDEDQVAEQEQAAVEEQKPAEERPQLKDHEQVQEEPSAKEHESAVEEMPVKNHDQGQDQQQDQGEILNDPKKAQDQDQNNEKDQLPDHEQTQEQLQEQLEDDLNPPHPCRRNRPRRRIGLESQHRVIQVLEREASKFFDITHRRLEAIRSCSASVASRAAVSSYCSPRLGSVFRPAIICSSGFGIPNVTLGLDRVNRVLLSQNKRHLKCFLVPSDQAKASDHGDLCRHDRSMASVTIDLVSVDNFVALRQAIEMRLNAMLRNQQQTMANSTLTHRELLQALVQANSNNSNNNITKSQVNGDGLSVPSASLKTVVNDGASGSTSPRRSSCARWQFQLAYCDLLGKHTPISILKTNWLSFCANASHLTLTFP